MKDLTDNKVYRQLYKRYELLQDKYHRSLYAGGHITKSEMKELEDMDDIIRAIYHGYDETS